MKTKQMLEILQQKLSVVDSKLRKVKIHEHDCTDEDVRKDIFRCRIKDTRYEIAIRVPKDDNIADYVGDTFVLEEITENYDVVVKSILIDHIVDFEISNTQLKIYEKFCKHAFRYVDELLEVKLSNIESDYSIVHTITFLDENGGPKC